jgi:hypothetical protein
MGMFSTVQRPPERPIFDEFVKPKLESMRIYNFRVPPTQVSPTVRVGTFPRPRGEEASKQAVIATAPKPKSQKQMVWLPQPKIQMPQDLAMPNLIARLNTALPALPAPPKKEPPQSDVETKAAQPNNSPPQPNADVNHAPESPNQVAKAPKPQAKAFVPPPPSPREPRLAQPTPVLDAPAPPPEAASMQSRLAVGAGIPATSSGALSSLTAPPAPVTNAGNANVDVVVASLRPPDAAKDVLPSGDRPGQFSKAPETGAPASGPVNSTNSVTVPNLTIRDEKKTPEKPAPPAAPRGILYTEKVRSIPVSTLSVPLRPSSRTIPRAVDARFQGRNVYTMVVPIENLPEYAGDWIVWFADREAKSGETPVMRAPIPYRKLAPVEQAAGNDRTGNRMQIAAVLGKDGKLTELSCITKAAADFEKAALQDLTAWEFKPATRNGSPIDIDIVIEIPFNLGPKIAQRTSQP